jgi:hypothetical protein
MHIFTCMSNLHLQAELLAAEESVRVARESAGEARAALEAEHMAATQVRGKRSSVVIHIHVTCHLILRV